MEMHQLLEHIAFFRDSGITHMGDAWAFSPEKPRKRDAGSSFSVNSEPVTGNCCILPHDELGHELWIRENS
jgi:hypothetical protein